MLSHHEVIELVSHWGRRQQSDPSSRPRLQMVHQTPALPELRPVRPRSGSKNTLMDLQGHTADRSMFPQPGKARLATIMQETLVNTHLHEVHTVLCNIRVDLLGFFVDEFPFVRIKNTLMAMLLCP